MLKLFGQTDKAFNSNGDRVIHALRARIKKEDNGEFYLELETDLSYANDITEGRIIIAPTPQGEQPFRIGNVTKTKNRISTKCLHVFFDSRNYLIADSYVVDKNCNDALDHLNNATEPVSEFTTISDIPTVNSYRCVRTSLYEAIQTVIERWGGHLALDGFQIGIRRTIGQDNGVVVRYAKNLKDITVEENWDEVVTKLLPVGRDGLLLDGLYVESTQQYDLPYTKTVSFDQDHIDEENYKDADGNLDEEAFTQALTEDLRSQAVEYVEANSLPKVNYTLQANLEKVTDIGDTVQVIDSRLGITVTTHVISYIYDCILGRYTELEFGNFKKTLSNFASNIAQQTQQAIKESNDSLKVTLNDELTNSTNQIWEALGNSYCIYEGDKILIVDSLPKETATNVIMINNGGIAFSQTGINGQFNSAWTIDGTLNMQNVNVINMTADLIKGGTLKLGSNLNEYGTLEIYDEKNTLVALMDKGGLKMYGQDGSYVLMNNEVGFAGFDRNGAKIYWVDKDEFHMKKSVVEEEITLCNKLRFIPITITNESGEIVNDGIGLVSVGSEDATTWQLADA
ncbi:phage tail spike protein [Megamonas hypermegale]|uniref:phage tail spike protein n=1 Tax=Megamonas hypermegale TaxID=158847 RepID=UPI0026EE5330|nr:phage tail spike protein [Megamonas hypermegale]